MSDSAFTPTLGPAGATGPSGATGPTGPTGPSNKRDLYVNWQHGSPPDSTGRFGGIWAIPFDGGSSLTFDITYVSFRMENAPTSAYTVRFEKSPAATSFTPTTITSLTLNAGSNVVDASNASFATVSSGDMVRINYTTIGAFSTADSITTITMQGKAQ